MKILIKHSCECSEDHFNFLKAKFESFGFEVLDKNIQCMVSELLLDDLNAVQYVVDFERVCYLHKNFFRELRTVFRAEVESAVTCTMLYFNNDMGLMSSKDRIVRIYTTSPVFEDFENVMDNAAIMVNNHIVACELSDAEFIAENSKFYKEFLTTEMLQNGDWRITG